MPPNTASDDHVVELLIAERVLVLVGLQQQGDEIIARRPCPTLLDHPVGVFEQGGGRFVDLRHVLLEGDAERQAHVAGNVGQPPPLALIEAEQDAGDPRRIRLGEFCHEVAAAAPGELVDDVVGEIGEFRLQRDDGFRRESGIRQPPQPRMIVANAAQQHTLPPIGKPAGHIVVGRPRIAALAQARIPQQLADILIAQHGDAIGCARTPTALSRLAHLRRASRETWIGEVQKG